MRRVARVVPIAALAAAVLFGVVGGGGHDRDIIGAGDAGASAGPTGALPSFSHLYVIVLENRAFADVIGNPAAPYLNSLADRYGLATDYDAVTHPSQPNYLALFSGSTHGVTDDAVHDIAAPTLADQLEGRGRSWRVFAENAPSGCFRGGLASGGQDGPGTYVRKHEPAISFTAISTNPGRCANITDFSHFDPAVADFELIVPNLCHDMHDCPVADGDRFLAGFVPRILESPAWSKGGGLFITFDEVDRGLSPSPRVALIVVAPGVAPGIRPAVHYTHYSLLRTIQEAWGLGCLAESCEANDLSEFFGTGGDPSPAVVRGATPP